MFNFVISQDSFYTLYGILPFILYLFRYKPFAVPKYSYWAWCLKAI